MSISSTLAAVSAICHGCSPQSFRETVSSGVHGHFNDGLVNGPLVLFSDDRLEDGGGVRRSRHRFPDGVKLCSIFVAKV